MLLCFLSWDDLTSVSANIDITTQKQSFLIHYYQYETLRCKTIDFYHITSILTHFHLKYKLVNNHSFYEYSLKLFPSCARKTKQTKTKQTNKQTNKQTRNKCSSSLIVLIDTCYTYILYAHITTVI